MPYSLEDLQAELARRETAQQQWSTPSPDWHDFSGTTGRSATNNNPLNLEFRPDSYQDKYGAEIEPVSKSGKQRFAKFPSMQAGYEAGLDQIRLDQQRGHTLASFVKKFAPPHENPTGSLIRQYSKSLGVSPSTPLKNIAPEDLILPMMVRESSTRVRGINDLEKRMNATAGKFAQDYSLEELQAELARREGGQDYSLEELQAELKSRGEDLSGLPKPEIDTSPEPQPLGDVTSDTLSQSVEPAGEMVGQAANLPFVPLEYAAKQASEKVLRPILTAAFPKATEDERRMVERGFEGVATLGFAPAYLKLIGKGAQLLQKAGKLGFYKYAPDWAFPKGEGGLPVPLPADEVVQRLKSMTGAERQAMVKKYPQFREIAREMWEAQEKPPVGTTEAPPQPSGQALPAEPGFVMQEQAAPQGFTMRPGEPQGNLPAAVGSGSRAVVAPEEISFANAQTIEKPNEIIPNGEERKISWEITDKEAQNVVNKFVSTLPYGDRFLRNFDWKFIKKNPHWKEDRFEFEYKPRGGEEIERPIIEGSDYLKKVIKFNNKGEIIKEPKSNPNYIYRGMSMDEWEQYQKQGYIQSEGLYNFENEKGLTLFANNINSAMSYAGGFAPQHLAGTFERPGIIIAIPKTYSVEIPGTKGYTTDYTAINKPIPLNEIKEIYRYVPSEAKKGKIDLLRDNHSGEVREGSRVGWSGSYDLIKAPDLRPPAQAPTPAPAPTPQAEAAKGGEGGVESPREKLIVYKGISRGGLVPNDMGLIFTTTDKNIAEKYTMFSGEGEKGKIVTGEISPDVELADLSDRKTVEKIVNELPLVSAEWDRIDTDAKYKTDLINELLNKHNQGEGDIMDDPHISRAVALLGYDGIKTGDIIVLNNPEVLISTPPPQPSPEGAVEGTNVVAPDYVKGYLSQYKKGQPGITQGMERPDGSGEIVYRNEQGKPVGVLAYSPKEITDIAVSKQYQRQGIASQLIDDAIKRNPDLTFKGPFTKEGAALVNKYNQVRLSRAEGVTEPSAEKAGEFSVGSKLSNDYVFHNTKKEFLQKITTEGLSAGAFSDKPIAFGGDIFLAVKKSDLPQYQEHTYGNAMSFEPNYVIGYDKEGFPIETAIPPERIYLVDKSKKVIQNLGGKTPPLTPEITAARDRLATEPKDSVIENVADVIRKINREALLSKKEKDWSSLNVSDILYKNDNDYKILTDAKNELRQRGPKTEQRGDAIHTVPGNLTVEETKLLDRIINRIDWLESQYQGRATEKAKTGVMSPEEAKVEIYKRKEIQDARNILAAQKNVAPDKLEYIGDMEVGERKIHQFNIMDPEHPQFKSTVSVEGGKPKKVPPGELGAIGPDLDPARIAQDPQAQKVEQAYEKAEAELKDLKSVKLKRLYEKAKVMTVDTSGNLKKKLLQDAGAEGREMVMRHDLSRGASAKAKAIIEDAVDNIYKDLSRSEETILNRALRANRDLTIRQYKPDHRVTGGLTDGELQAYLDSVPKHISGKIKDYSKVMDDNLDAMLKEGLLTKKGHQALKEKGDYLKTKYIQYLDPDRQGFDSRGRKITVPDSGIKKLETGSEQAAEMNSRLLMAEAISRTQGRIARNRTNNALYEYIKENPDNPFDFKLAKVYRKTKGVPKAEEVPWEDVPPDYDMTEVKPEPKVTYQWDVPNGYTEVSVMKEGKRIRMIMPDKYAREWIQSDPMLSPQLANIIGWVSGSKILKAFATGVNPGFALTNMPRDIAHIWLVTNEYSTAGPKALAQIGKDMIEVAKDTFTRKGAYRDYIDEGGGMGFLTHQGELNLGVTGTLAKAQQYLAWLGETSEIWTRLAVRNRAIKNGKTPIEATWEARNYLDFAQGGSLAKAADTAIPYLNAGIQGSRKVFQAAADDPKTFSWKVAQIGALATGLYLANSTWNKEAWDQVPEYEKRTNWIITTPITYKDKAGDKRYLYFRIAKDQGQRVFAALFEGFMAKLKGDKFNFDYIVDALGDALPLMPNQKVWSEMLPPTMRAGLGYYANRDFWRNQDFWRGPKVKTSEEFNRFTNPGAILAGKYTGLSPARLQGALNQLVPSTNTYASLVGAGFKELLDTMPEKEREKTLAEMVSNNAFLGKLVRPTSPYEPFKQRMEDVKVEENTRRYQQRRDIENLVEQNSDKSRPERYKAYRDYIKKYPPVDRKRLMNEARGYEKYQDIPDRRWWLNLKHMPPETRATMYYERFKTADPEEQKQLNRQMLILPGIKSQRFIQELTRLKRRANQ